MNKLHKIITNKLKTGDIDGIMDMLDPEKVGDMEGAAKELKRFSNMNQNMNPNKELN